MRIRSISVSHYRGVRAVTLTLGQGLNVLYGLNDIGKSSLADAVRAGFLLPSTSSEAKDLVPWGTCDVPTVVIEFEHDQHSWRVTKTFGIGGKSLLEKSKSGHRWNDEAKGRDVDGRLRDLLSWGIPVPGGKGGQKGMARSFLTTALLGYQGDVSSILRVGMESDSTDSGMAIVTAALGALGQDPVVGRMLGRLDERVADAFTPTGKFSRKENSPLFKVSQRLSARLADLKVVEENARRSAEIETNIRERIIRRDKIADERDVAEANVKAEQHRLDVGERRTVAQRAIDDARAELDQVLGFLAASSESSTALEHAEGALSVATESLRDAEISLRIQEEMTQKAKEEIGALQAKQAAAQLQAQHDEELFEADRKAKLQEAHRRIATARRVQALDERVSELRKELDSAQTNVARAQEALNLANTNFRLAEAVVFQRKVAEARLAATESEAASLGAAARYVDVEEADKAGESAAEQASTRIESARAAYLDAKNLAERARDKLVNDSRAATVAAQSQIEQARDVGALERRLKALELELQRARTDAEECARVRAASERQLRLVEIRQTRAAAAAADFAHRAAVETAEEAEHALRERIENVDLCERRIQELELRSDEARKRGDDARGIQALHAQAASRTTELKFANAAADAAHVRVMTAERLVQVSDLRIEEHRAEGALRAAEEAASKFRECDGAYAKATVELKQCEDAVARERGRLELVTEFVGATSKEREADNALEQTRATVKRHEEIASYAHAVTIAEEAVRNAKRIESGSSVALEAAEENQRELRAIEVWIRHESLERQIAAAMARADSAEDERARLSAERTRADGMEAALTANALPAAERLEALKELDRRRRSLDCDDGLPRARHASVVLPIAVAAAIGLMVVLLGISFGAGLPVGATLGLSALLVSGFLFVVVRRRKSKSLAARAERADADRGYLQRRWEEEVAPILRATKAPDLEALEKLCLDAEDQRAKVRDLRDSIARLEGQTFARESVLEPVARWRVERDSLASQFDGFTRGILAAGAARISSASTGIESAVRQAELAVTDRRSARDRRRVEQSKASLELEATRSKLEYARASLPASASSHDPREALVTAERLFESARQNTAKLRSRINAIDVSSASPADLTAADAKARIHAAEIALKAKGAARDEAQRRRAEAEANSHERSKSAATLDLPECQKRIAIILAALGSCTPSEPLDRVALEHALAQSREGLASARNSVARIDALTEDAVSALERARATFSQTWSVAATPPSDDRLDETHDQFSDRPDSGLADAEASLGVALDAVQTAKLFVSESKAAEVLARAAASDASTRKVSLEIAVTTEWACEVGALEAVLDEESRAAFSGNGSNLTEARAARDEDDDTHRKAAAKVTGLQGSHDEARQAFERAQNALVAPWKDVLDAAEIAYQRAVEVVTSAQAPETQLLEFQSEIASKRSELEEALRLQKEVVERRDKEKAAVLEAATSRETFRAASENAKLAYDELVRRQHESTGATEIDRASWERRGGLGIETDGDGSGLNVDRARAERDALATQVEHARAAMIQLEGSHVEAISAFERAKEALGTGWADAVAEATATVDRVETPQTSYAAIQQQIADAAATALADAQARHTLADAQLTALRPLVAEARTQSENAREARDLRRGTHAELTKQARESDRLAAEEMLAEAQAVLATIPQTSGDANALESALSKRENLEKDLQHAEGEVREFRGKLTEVGGAVVQERLQAETEAVERLREQAAELELEYEASLLLLTTLKDAEAKHAAHLGACLAKPVTERFRELTQDRYGAVSFGPKLNTVGLVARGGPQHYDSLSVGTREQLATLMRLALAAQLKTLLLLDDQLVHSDFARMEWFRQRLRVSVRDAHHQIIVFTAHPDAYVGKEEMPVGADTRRETDSGGLVVVNLAPMLSQAP